jgi:hypothetical protein
MFVIIGSIHVRMCVWGGGGGWGVWVCLYVCYNRIYTNVCMCVCEFKRVCVYERVHFCMCVIYRYLHVGICVCMFVHAIIGFVCLCVCEYKYAYDCVCEFMRMCACECVGDAMLIHIVR